MTKQLKLFLIIHVDKHTTPDNWLCVEVASHIYYVVHTVGWSFRPFTPSFTQQPFIEHLLDTQPYGRC